ncbi:alpha/beta hydrolase [Chryseobacterium oranimense]|uniref:alpha/beta hydrolase n=1 Tax=Chryseobacterium oranimense TaxID=421058 RepID=UPI0021AFBE26|nr:alpha/beta hydrolase [Chryseobacterium oranimense]UWX61783.1 alpha/beta hydrolase [Chryseobacterium oranimense]
MRFIKTIIYQLVLFALINSKIMAQSNEIYKKEYFIKSTDNVQLQIKEIYDQNNLNSAILPLLMVHGGGPDAITSFDLDTEFPSFAEELASKGLHIFLLNIRGWGKSSLPEYNLSDKNLIIGNVDEASDDIQSALNWITYNFKIPKVNLFGWATGGHWISYTAIKNPKNINSIISLNSLYGINGDWSLHKFYALPDDNLKYNKSSFFRESPKETLTTSWTNTIPVEDKADWRSPVVEKAYKDQACTYGSDKNIFKVPAGFQEESFYMALGKKYWDAKDLTVPAMIIRSEYDFWSRSIDLNAFKNDFPKYIHSRFETINGTHYLFLDKDDKGKTELIDLILRFIQE